ncbi:excinuclease ABC subunit UvrC [Alphaproteobacteria bacterium]|nr:excinuclease ABC subunit UvrC [Alphaproteobacteria bacterium]
MSVTSVEKTVVDKPLAGKVKPRPDIEAGIAVVQEQVRNLPSSPGVYRMLDANGDVLYVGKARNLKKRVVSYTTPTKVSHRIFRMISETISMVIVTTHTEVEALLLESNLIKRLKPRYNVLMRDDKSFPHILITGDHQWPRIIKHRGSQSKLGTYFGPFASAGAVNRTITALQRAFLIRNCSDAVFKSRTRPCLQYQIKRCAAPCVDYVSSEDYGELVSQARGFLSGESGAVQRALATRMQDASDAMEFETAALYRDRIRAMTQVQAHQDINVEGLADADAFALHGESGSSCIQVFFFRGGSNYGNRAYFPSHDKTHDPAEVLAAFIGQFYDNKQPPRLVLVSHELDEQTLLGEALCVKADHKVEILMPKRGPKRKLVEHARTNARDALGRRMAESASHRRMLDGVAAALGLEAAPNRIEVYDNSHIQGTNAVGAMIVAGPDGFMKNAYRKFNIRNVINAGKPPANTVDQHDQEMVQGGDDYAMMRQVLKRRFARAQKEDPDRDQGTWPDLVLIDGGPGQLSIAVEVARELGIQDVPLVAISKGPDRGAGREKFHIPGKPAMSMPERDPILYYLQRLRDEAHRFAIESHRARRTKAISHSGLDNVPGIGAKRKRSLLHHFGSARAVSRAGLVDLESVDGVSKAVAKRIYEYFHDDA